MTSAPPPFALRFSNRYLDVELHGTIWQHVRIIEELRSAGQPDHKCYCWWGWWRSQNGFDRISDPSERLEQTLSAGPVEIFLFSRSLARAYTARVEEVRTNHGNDILTPEPENTPAYYRDKAFPAWFRISKIQRIDRARITEDSETDLEDSDHIDRLEARFRELGEDDSTLLWYNTTTPNELPAWVTSTERTGVLHISDLHFGSEHIWSSTISKNQAKLDTVSAIRTAFQQHNIQPKSIGAIVLSGDVSDRGPSQDRYSAAKRFLDSLFTYTATSPDNLVMVPGNHDVVRHQLVDGQQPFDPTSKEFMTREAEQEYHAFVEDIYGRPSAVTRIRRFEFRRNSLNFLQLNSTLPKDNLTKEYGFLGQDPIRFLQYLERLAEDAPADRPVTNICVQHHHLIPTVDEEQYVREPYDSSSPDSIPSPVSLLLDASRVIDWCRQYRVRFVLHGHQHKFKMRFLGDDSREQGDRAFLTHVIGAGSLGATWTLDGAPNGFNLLDFSDDDGQRVHVRAFAVTRTQTKEPLIRDAWLPVPGEVEW